MAERFKRVIELMHGDSSRTFSLGEMAESVNLSPLYFCYLFKSVRNQRVNRRWNRANSCRLAFRLQVFALS